MDGVIFVFAVDRTELAHSVRAIYGSEFDAIGYLRRFFDVDYTLPTPERSNFIEALIRSSQIPEYFGRTLDPHGKKEQGFILRMTSKMLGGSSVGLRDIAQGIHRLGLVLGSLPDDKRSFALTASVLVVLRTLQPAAYQEVVAGKRSAAKILDAIFSGPALAELRPTQLGRLFEATLIGGVLEAHGQSETYSELKALSEQMVPKDEPVPEQVEHARAVVHLISELHDSFFGGGIGFKFSVERLELLSPELKPVSE